MACSRRSSSSNNNNNEMAKLLLLLILITCSSIMIKCQNQNHKEDLAVAVEEMQRANYYTFVTLINMAPPSALLNGNITFFMPKDRALSASNLSLISSSSQSQEEDVISDFLLRHSIPSPLLMDHLLRLPTASILPTSLPHYMIQIRNGGRSNYLLNNVKLISPNLCTSTSTIRCHGIAGVLPAITMLQQDSSNTNVPPSCSTTIPPPPAPSPPPDSEINNNASFVGAPGAAPSPAHPPHQSAATSNHHTTQRWWKGFVESCIIFCFSFLIIYAAM